MTDPAALLSGPEALPSNGDPDLEASVLEKIKEEYAYYCSDVKFWVDMVEVCYDHTPDGLAYEVRAFTGHIGDALIRTDRPVEERLRNIQDAHTHLRRIVLDCLKTVGIWQRDQFAAFDKKYRWSDLSEINNGTFRSEYAALKKEAINAFKRAKAAERPGKNDRGSETSEDVYDLYYSAYNANTAVLDFLDASYVAIDRAASRSIRAKIFSYVGWLAGIVGLVLTYISFTRPCP